MSEIKTAEKCLDIIAQKYNYKDWYDLHYKVGGTEMDSYTIEAMQFYHAQFKEVKPKEVPKMRIIDAAKGLMFVPQSVPMEMLTERMAQKNHGQTLQGLNSRGGLSIMEILANLKNDRIVRGTETQKDVDELNELIKQYENRNSTKETVNIDKLFFWFSSFLWNKSYVEGGKVDYSQLLKYGDEFIKEIIKQKPISIQRKEVVSDDEIRKIATELYVGNNGSITTEHLKHINSFIDGYKYLLSKQQN